MTIIEFRSGADRRSLLDRFMRKSKADAISQLVDFHLLNCKRMEKLEELLAEAVQELPGGSALAPRIRDYLPTGD